MQTCTQLQPVLVTLTAASNDVATSSDGVISLVAARVFQRMRPENNADHLLFLNRDLALEEPLAATEALAASDAIDDHSIL